MNRVNLIGRLTKDIENRTTTSGISIAMFDLAVNSNFTDKEGKLKTNFIRCRAYNKTADILFKYTKKGSQIGVEGEISTGSYENNEGKKTYYTEVLVSKIDLLDRKENQNPNNTTSATSAETTQSSVKNNPYQDFADEVVIDPNELPF